MLPQHKYYPKTDVQKLGYLAEECGEVLAAVGKTIRWGLDSYNPELPETERETNRQWILRELQDLKTAIAIVERAF
jgi:NTP pyrophosphatase (non-canonical NTP hydrolase)